MATTLAVEQAIQRLIYSPSRSKNESGDMTVARPPQNNIVATNGRVAANPHFTPSNKPAVEIRPGRNGSHSRYCDNETMANGVESFHCNNPSLPISFRHGGQTRHNGRAKSNIESSSHGHPESYELDGSGMVRASFPSQAPSPISDVQKCLKNIIMSQANIIKKQQKLLEEKEREIVELRRENDSLKNSTRSVDKRSPTATVAQQCDFEEFDDKTPFKRSLSSTKSITNDDGVAIEARIKADRLGNVSGANGRAIRQRLSSDLVVAACNVIKERHGADPIAKRLRSGRQRATVEEGQNPQPIKRRRKRKPESTIGSPLTRRQLSKTSKNGKRRRSESEHVQTPGWRIVQLTAGGVLEGTENITDEAFSKRHQKCEVEERRVIRRDKMRQREELLKEKLAKADHHHRLVKQKRDKRDSESSAPPNDVNDLQAIEICGNHLTKSSTQHDVATDF